MTAPARDFPPRTFLLDRLHSLVDAEGCLNPEAVAQIALELRIPAAEAWAAATSFPEFPLEPPLGSAGAMPGAELPAARGSPLTVRARPAHFNATRPL